MGASRARSSSFPGETAEIDSRSVCVWAPLAFIEDEPPSGAARELVDAGGGVCGPLGFISAKARMVTRPLEKHTRMSRSGPETDVHVADGGDRHADAMGRVAVPA